MVTYRLFSRAGFTGSGCGVVSAIGAGGLKEFSILPIHMGDYLAYELIVNSVSIFTKIFGAVCVLVIMQRSGVISRWLH